MHSPECCHFVLNVPKVRLMFCCVFFVNMKLSLHSVMYVLRSSHFAFWNEGTSRFVYFSSIGVILTSASTASWSERPGRVMILFTSDALLEGLI